MTIVGTLLKETTRFSYQLTQKKTVQNSQQTKVLLNLLNQAKKTTLGEHFHFTALLKAENIEESFAEKLPIYTYESFYEAWLKDAISGEKNHIWPGRINFYALTSGTTSAASKRIPVSDQMLQQFQKTTLKQIISLHKMDLPASFYNASVLTIGGSTKLTQVGNHLEGDLSGILQKNKSLFVKPFSKPGQKTAQIKDWNEKMNEIVRKAPRWDIGVIAGVPSWILMLLERIVKTYNLDTIHDIWPNFQLYLHGGVFLDNYKERIIKLCKKSPHFINTYLASEGYFAYQEHPNDMGMKLLKEHGVYYEFVEDQYFELLTAGVDLEKIPTLTLAEIEAQKNYALIVTTTSGLWRYVMGDVVKFINIVNHELTIVGRISHTINMLGEHLSLENMIKAVNYAAKKMGVDVEEFCVSASKKLDRHHWYIGSNQVIEEQLFGAYLNECLEEINDDYRSVRKILLRTPKIKALPLQKFYDFMELKGKTGGQHKFPRVLNKTQTKDWESFLNCLDW